MLLFGPISLTFKASLSSLIPLLVLERGLCGECITFPVIAVSSRACRKPAFSGFFQGFRLFQFLCKWTSVPMHLSDSVAFPVFAELPAFVSMPIASLPAQSS